MEIRQGIGVFPGYAIGPAFVIDREEFRIERRKIAATEVKAELARLDSALATAEEEIGKPLSRHAAKLGPAAGILRAHLTLIQDQGMRDEIRQGVERKQQTAEYSAARTIRKRIKALMATGRMSYVERVVQDLNDLEKSLLRHLLETRREDISSLTTPAIVVAHTLSPAQTLSLDREKVLGLLTEIGGRTSHTALVAASLGIPAVVGIENITQEVTGGDPVILDGGSGRVIIDPDEGTLKRYSAMERNFRVVERRVADEMRTLPAQTRDGQRITLLTNIESPDEIPAALEYGAEGVGMYRTEFLYLQNEFAPTEEDHLRVYRKAIASLAGRRLVIRTLDLGADKMPLDGIPLEDNPYLGTRAIRLCLARPEIFKVQVRAILRASAEGPVQVMLPMVSALYEIEQARDLLQQSRKDLRREGIRVPDEIEAGIMIEVPSVAVAIDIYAPHVDFLSIGTNDLIGYSFAVDRGNERVAPLYQPAHPAILRMIKNVLDTGERLKKPVSVCGEMSSDPLFTLLLLGMGLKIFSVVPPAIPDIKKLIRSVTMDEARQIAQKALEGTDSRQTVAYLKEMTRQYLPEMQ